MIKRGNVGDDSDGSLANLSPLSIAESVSLSWQVFQIRFLLSPRYLLQADDLDRPERLPHWSHVPPGTFMTRISTCPLSYHYGLICLLQKLWPSWQMIWIIDRICYLDGLWLRLLLYFVQKCVNLCQKICIAKLCRMEWSLWCSWFQATVPLLLCNNIYIPTYKL